MLGKIKYLPIFLCFFIFIKPLYADGIKNYLSRPIVYFEDYADAFYLRRDQVDEMAKSKDSITAFKAAIYYHYVLRDRNLAIRALRPLARKDFADANTLLGIIYFEMQNLSNAYPYLLKADRQGSAQGSYELAKIYLSGQSMFNKPEEAITLIIKAADRELKIAQYDVANFYIRGDVLPRNLTIAKEIYVQMYEYVTDKRLLVNLAKKIIALYDQLEKRSDDVAEQQKYSQEKINYYLFLAEENDDQSAMLYLANAYLNGVGVDIEYDKSTSWLIQAAESGNVNAMEKLAFNYISGANGNRKDLKEAFKWYENAAYSGSKTASWNLGYMYYNGLGVEKDLQRSKYWFGKSK